MLTDRQRKQAARHAFEAHHLQADQFAHAAQLARLALGQHKAQLLRILPLHLRRLQGFTVQRQAVP